MKTHTLKQKRKNTMTRSEIFRKAHANAASWMSKQNNYASMHKYSSYAECFAACLRSIYCDIREEKNIERFYSRYDKQLQAARLQD